MKKIIKFDERPGNYVAVLSYKDEEEVLRVVWKIIQIYGEDADGRPLYRLDDDIGYDLTDDIDKAESAVHGFCKWDGCAEFRMDTHVCSPDGVGVLLDAIKRVYVECADVMERDIQEMCAKKGW